eukprot:scaffold90061_cov66-Phaeocystis_antarctica.AAC.16
MGREGRRPRVDPGAGSDPIAIEYSIIYQTRKQTHSEGEVSRTLSALLALNQALKIVYMHYGAVFTIAEQLRPLGSRSCTHIPPWWCR